MPHIPKVICAVCNREMKVLKNGVVLEALMQTHAKSGDGYMGYYKIYCDSWKCSTCEYIIYTGLAQARVAHHFEEDYDEIKADVQFKFAGE